MVFIDKVIILDFDKKYEVIVMVFFGFSNFNNFSIILFSSLVDIGNINFY